MPGHLRIKKKKPLDTTRELMPGERCVRLVTVCRIRTTNNTEYWLCECECGKLTKITKNDFLHRKRKSCGCYRRSDIPLVEKSTDVPIKVRRAWAKAKHKGILCRKWFVDVRVFYRDVGDPPNEFCSLKRRDTKKKLHSANWYWSGAGGVELEIER